MRVGVVMFGCLLFFNASFAYTSGIAIRSDKTIVVQVFINGKLYNKKPSNYIRIKSTQGLFHLRVRVLDLSTHTWRTITQSVQITKGFEYQYSVETNKKMLPILRLIKRYPVYSKYFLNYGLYTRSSTG
jgi:hypothetical protein